MFMKTYYQAPKMVLNTIVFSLLQKKVTQLVHTNSRFEPGFGPELLFLGNTAIAQEGVRATIQISSDYWRPQNDIQCHPLMEIFLYTLAFLHPLQPPRPYNSFLSPRPGHQFKNKSMGGHLPCCTDFFLLIEILHIKCQQLAQKGGC